jgi:hypothetical protein
MLKYFRGRTSVNKRQCFNASTIVEKRQSFNASMGEIIVVNDNALMIE